MAVHDSAHQWVSTSVQRREDPNLLTGKGHYTADIKFPNMAHVAFVRSAYAHALLRSIDVTAAMALPGVLAVFTGSDLRHLNPFPVMVPIKEPIRTFADVEVRTVDRFPLARDRVCYVGEPVVAVVAKDRYVAEDARDLVDVQYDPLPVLTDPEKALEPGAERIYPEWPDNCHLRFHFEVGNTSEAFAQAAIIVRERFVSHRYTGIPMEGRAVTTEFDARTGNVMVYSSTQVPHDVRTWIAHCIGWPEAKIRVVAPDVGGGFGPKNLVYPEEVLMPWIAMKLGCPVQWVEDRLEHMMSTGHARDQIHDIELAADGDGHILGVRDRYVVDAGADNRFQLVVPYNTAAHLPGPYRVPNYAVECRVAITNKVPAVPYRGAGRPEAVFAMDRALDQLARRMGLDAIEIRKRNLIRGEEFPYHPGFLYRDGRPAEYDSGDYALAFDKLCEALDVNEFRQRQHAERERGRYLGIGVSGYVEGTGIGPFEGAIVRIDDTGHIVVSTGASPHGQGHLTVFSQIVADAFGIHPDDVIVIAGDSAAIPYGVGTFASRTAVVAGTGVYHAAQLCVDKVRALAAHLLECAFEDVELQNGNAFVSGVPSRYVTLREVAQAARPGITPLADPGLDGVAYFVPDGVTMASGMHGCIVEVDPALGETKVLRYVVVHDAGRLLNPMIAEGQVHGGVVQGLGGALFEAMKYGKDGQLLTLSFLDYPLIGASRVPPIDIIDLPFPSPGNPLGVKGIGEGGAVSTPAAVASAVEDALAPFGVVIRKTPLTVEAVLEAIAEVEVPR